MMADDTETQITRGTSNIFADLGFPDPETHLLKAQLVVRLSSVIQVRKLTQAAAAKLTGISQPDLSRLLRGRFRDVSVERIMSMLTRLGCEIDIVVRAQEKVAPDHPIQLRPAAA
jgi:predicted XRE-type DNA-binding protein